MKNKAKDNPELPVEEIVALLNEKDEGGSRYSFREIAVMTGVTQSRVSAICKSEGIDRIHRKKPAKEPAKKESRPQPVERKTVTTVPENTVEDEIEPEEIDLSQIKKSDLPNFIPDINFFFQTVQALAETDGAGNYVYSYEEIMSRTGFTYVQLFEIREMAGLPPRLSKNIVSKNNKMD